MDEKDQKTLTVGDILDQLVKPSVIQGQAASQPPKIESKTEQVSEKKSVNAEISLPQLGKSEPLGLPKINTADNVVARQKLLIRTMAGDLEMLKKGSKPLSVELKRQTSTSEKNKEPEKPGEPVKKPEPPIRSALPSLPSVRPYPMPARPSASSPLLKADNFHIKAEMHIPHEDEDLLPPFPGAPMPKKIAKTQEEKVEYGVIARIVSSGMTTGIISTVVVAILAYILLSIFFFREKENPVPTVSVQPSGTPVQALNELEVIFGAFSSSTLVLKEDGALAVSDLGNFVKSEVIVKKEFKKLQFLSVDQQKLTFVDILNKLGVYYPPEIREWLGSNNMALLYGQEELFDGSEPIPAGRLVLIVEVKDETAVRSIMQKWELTMPQDLARVFAFDPSKQVTRDFLSNDRRGVLIRYKNFPLPDKAVDYAIVRSLAGKNYLILSNSREAMFSPADKIRGL